MNEEKKKIIIDFLKEQIRHPRIDEKYGIYCLQCKRWNWGEGVILKLIDEVKKA